MKNCKLTIYADVIMNPFYVVWVSKDDVYCAMGMPMQLQTRDWKLYFKICDVYFGFIFVRHIRF
jgi:hypothetical protein